MAKNKDFNGRQSLVICVSDDIQIFPESFNRIYTIR